MNIIHKGDGTPVVVNSGIQGRRESIQPAIDARAERCRVITSQFADEHAWR
jgi:hypothetical protein